ncbi:MAG: hypothetical protein WBO70_03960 [Erysipelotrichaceae bacterium]
MQINSYRLFYSDSFPNVWVIKTDIEKNCDHYVVNKNVVILYSDNDEIVGINILNMPILEKKGYNYFNEELIEVLNPLLQDNNLPLVVLKPNNIRVGRILSYVQEDNLRVCEVRVLDKIIQVVTNRDNFVENDLVYVALENAIIPDGTLIKDSKVYGHPSQGMFLSSRTLQLDLNDSNLLIVNDKNEGDYYSGR